MGSERGSRREDRQRSSRDRSRDRDRDDRRHKEERRDKERSRRRSRSRSRSRSRGRHKRDRSEERERKRSRRDSSPKATPPAAAAAAAPAAAPPAAEPGPPLTMEAARAAALAGHDAEEARRAEREAEQARLDAEMEKRRKRIQAWQEQRRKEEEAAKAAEAAAGGGADAEPAKKQKAWTLEDESSDDDEGGEGGDVAADGDAGAAAAAADGGGGAAPSTAAPSGASPMEEDEVDPLDAFMQSSVLPAVQQAEAEAAQVQAAAEDEDEVDPLDVFMQSNVLPAVQQQQAQQQQAQQPAAEAAPPAAAAAAQQGAVPAVVKPAGAKPLAIKLKIGPGVAAAAAAAANGEATSKPSRPRSRARTRYDTDSSEDEGGSSEEEKEEESEDEAEWMRKLIAGKLSKGDKLVAVDHGTIQYPPFRRNFYIEVPELARMTPAEVEEYRRQLDGVKVRGKDVPKPVKNWHQCGLSSRVLDVLRKGGFERPLAIQAQALPVIMSGRDCIGIAKTGSGKTLAFVLPMLRHVKDQPPLVQGDGPVALSMAPTRELVTQISKEVKRFAKSVGLTCVAVYGGSGVANQITELKRGTEIVVCTPGRMIDILVTSGGKITNLRRVTYLVLDEADRMFDMGFEPQIMRIVQNIRPDRQTVMFSATFPRQVEVLARQVLTNPVEIQVGGRSVVNKDITQYVEIRPEEDRFLRLLEILGDWYEKGKLLIFVSSQDRCDTLFRDLLRAGYPCLSLHGGKDQSDRESTIVDFKANVCNILVATSVAARGLDVKDLVLVVNYDVPNHHEDYVHRVGRTGRAGAKGTAITFIGPDEAQYSPDLVKALKESGAPIPQDLQAMADAFLKSCKEGKAQLHSSGFGGSGFKFDASEDNAIKAYKKSLVKDMLKAQGEDVGSESEGEDEEIREVIGGKNVLQPAGQPGVLGPPPTAAQAQAALLAQQQGGILTAQQIAAMQAAAQPAAAQPGAAAGPSDEQLSSLPPEIQARVKAARELAAKLTSQPAVPNMAAVPSMAAAPWQAGVAAALAAVPGAAAAAAAVAGQPAAVPAAPAAPAAAANPILAAAQAAAARLAQEAGLPQPTYQQAAAAPPMAPPPGVVVPPVPGAAGAPGMAPAAAAAAPGAVAGAVPGAPRLQIPSELAAMMLGPGGQLPAAALPGALPGMPPGAFPGAVPGVLPGALPGVLPGAVPGAVPGAPSALAPQPAKHFETELEINDFPQHARWKITHRETIRDIGELGAAVVVKGERSGRPTGAPPSAGSLQQPSAQPAAGASPARPPAHALVSPSPPSWGIPSASELHPHLSPLYHLRPPAGKYYKLGTAPGPTDERKLYLHIEGPTAEVVKRAKQEIKRILEESTEKAMRREGPSVGRYSVM
ncbi:hypothetical protein ABPG75_006212 [Micractinium tetrahymenae]